MVPVQIGYSRGADMVVVDRGIASVNQLAGKVLAASQFNESEFFIRYLAQEAGVPVAVLRDLDARAAAGALGLVFYEDAFVACDAYERELARARARGSQGCVGWTPAHRRGRRGLGRRGEGARLEPEPARRGGRPRREQGFAQQNPKMVEGLVHGHPRGQPAPARPARRRTSPSSRGRSAGREAEARDELARVHLANLPENLAFFAGTIDSAGSFGGIFQSSVLAYGSVIKNPADPARFADTTHLEALAKQGLYADQKIAIAPIQSVDAGRARGRPAAQQGHPLLLRAELRRSSTRTRRRTSSTSTRSSASSR